MRRAASEQGVGSTISDLSHTDNPFPLTSTISTEVLIEEFSRGMCSSTTPGRHTSPPIAGGPFFAARHVGAAIAQRAGARAGPSFRDRRRLDDRDMKSLV